MDWKLIPATTSRYCYGVTSINWLPSYLASSSILLLLFQPSIQDKTWARNILTHTIEIPLWKVHNTVLFFFSCTTETCTTGKLSHNCCSALSWDIFAHQWNYSKHDENALILEWNIHTTDATKIGACSWKCSHPQDWNWSNDFFFFTQTRGGVQIGNLEKIFPSVFPGWSCPLRHASRCLHCYKNCQIATTDTFSHYWVFINSWAKLKSSHAHYWNAFTLYWSIYSVYENSSVVFEKSSLLNWTLSSS